MKILFLMNTAHLPQSIGGSEWSVHHFAKGLQAAGHSVAVLARLKDAGAIGIRNKIARGIGKRSFPSDRVMGYTCFRGWDMNRGLDEVASHFKPDVVFVVGSGAGVFPLCLRAKQMGLKLVYSVMDVSFNGHGGDLRELQGVKFISNSEFTAGRVRDLFNLPSTVVRPPIAISRCQVSKTGKKVVMVNPRESKGGNIAMALAQARPDIPFAFYEAWSGDMTSMKKQALAAKNVAWSRPVLDPRKIYRNARVLLVPSQAEEAWGMVASEAQCSGIPVIGSDIGGLSEAIGSGGMKIAPDAPLAEWCAALDFLWNDQKEWSTMSLAALDYSQRKEIQLETQIAILQSVLQEAASVANPATTRQVPTYSLDVDEELQAA